MGLNTSTRLLEQRLMGLNTSARLLEQLLMGLHEHITRLLEQRLLTTALHRTLADQYGMAFQMITFFPGYFSLGRALFPGHDEVNVRCRA